MFAQRGMFSRLGRATALATVAAVALSVAAPSAFAGSAPAQKGVSANSKDGGATDVSARRRVVARHNRGGNGGAAAAAAFAGIVGTGLAIAASRNSRDYDEDYYDRPAYYGPNRYYSGPTYYGGGYNQGW
jgi:hypothetical protein